MVNRINQPSDNKNRNLVNVPPPELGEEILGVHSARVDEALVTAALYLDARDLKSVRNIQNKRATRPFSAFKRGNGVGFSCNATGHCNRD